ILFPAQFRSRHADADLNGFDRVDAHHGCGQILVELAIDRRSPAGWHAVRHDLDHRPHRSTALADVIELARPGLDDAGVGRKERVLLRLVPRPAAAIDAVLPDLDECAAHRDAGDDLAGDGTGSDPCRRLAGARASAAAVVADAVLGPIGK